MKFDNYFSFLEDYDNKNPKESICLYGVSEIIKELYSDLKKSGKQDLLKVIKDELGVPYMTFYCWVKGSNPIPISKTYKLLRLWKNICNKKDLDFFIIWDRLYLFCNGYSQNGQRRVNLPKYLDNDLGYLIGFFQGDGHLKKRELVNFQEYSLYFYERDQNVLKIINSILYKKFNVKGNIYFQSNHTGSWYTLRLSSKPVYLFFDKTLGLKTGKKVREIVTPEIIKNTSLDIQLSFIRGFFDAEGGVGETNKNPWLEIGQASKEVPSEILFWVCNKLRECGVSLSNPQKSAKQDFFRLRTSNRDTIEKFFKVVSSYHPKKINRFEKIINK